MSRSTMRFYMSALLALTALLVGSRSLAGPSETAIYVPDHYDRNTRWPVVILLHGAGATGDMQDLHLGIRERVTQKGIILVVPEARPTAGSGITSNAQMLRLIEDVGRNYSVDANRIYLIGHSMGGYQSLSFACDHGDKIAGMVISAASGSCSNSNAAPVNLLLATGDADISNQNVEATLSSRRRINGCTKESTIGKGLDLHWDIAGAETNKTVWDRCNGGKTVVSLRSRFGRHVPIFKGSFAEEALNFLVGSNEAVPESLCVPEHDDRGRYVSSQTVKRADKTSLMIREYSDSQCQNLLATVEFTGPAGQGNGQTVFGFKFEDVLVTLSDETLVDDLNGISANRAVCNNNWQVDQTFVVSGRSSTGRQTCIATVGDISGPASFVKKLVLSYLFSPPLP